MTNKTKLIMFATSALLILGGAFFVQAKYADYIKTKSERDAYRNNTVALYDIIAKKDKEARVLELNAADLRQSNDSMIQIIEKERKSLKTPKNASGDVSAGVSTTVIALDSIKTPKLNGIELDTTISFNKFTRSRITIKNSTLKNELDINNILILFVYSRREYVNEYKSWLQRLGHLDYKRVLVTRYSITNTNPLVRTDSTRVIKIK